MKTEIDKKLCMFFMSEDLGHLGHFDVQTLEQSAAEDICTYHVCVMTNKRKQQLSANGKFYVLLTAHPCIIF